MNKRKYVLMNADPGAAGGGEAGAAGAANAGAGSGVVDPGAGAGGGAGSALVKPVPLHERIPEKFHVKKGEEFDAEASMGKVLESYQALEKRFGSGDAPPKAAEEYTFTVPEALKGTIELDDAKLGAFKQDALAAGMTQKQFEFAMGKFLEATPQLLQGAIQNTADATMANLEKAWGGEYQKNIDAAMKVFDTFATPEEKGKFDEIMTNPAIAYQMLARIAPELGEARGVPSNADAGGEGESIQQLLVSEAAGNPKHPDHKATRTKIDAYYAKKYGSAPVN
jgi:hypothetical protein